MADKGASYGRGLNRVQALQRELRLARTATVDTMLRNDPHWTQTAIDAAWTKHTDTPRDELHPRERERLKQKVYASVFSIIIQDIEDQALSAAATELSGCGWIAHSFQLDGILVERGFLPGGRPAVPLRADDGTGALSRAEAAIEAKTRINISMIEKPFHISYGDGTSIPACIVQIMDSLVLPRN